MPHLTPSRILRHLPRIIVAIGVIYAFLWVTGFPPQWEDEDNPHTPPPPSSPQPHTPAREEVIVSIKTGATEAYDKLPPLLLLTNPVYYDTLLLFSDLEQDIGAFHLHNVLDRFNSEEMMNNTDFDIYLKQEAYARLGLDIRSLKDEKDPNPNWRTKGHNAAWALDKYKFLHMLQRAWELKPEKEWYVFIETDTYLVRSNLMIWLGQFDARKPYYFGNPTQNPHYKDGDTYPFGHGGSGFIISGGAMHALLEERKGAINTWDRRIRDMWFGDYLIAAALHDEIGLNITPAWPQMSGMKPISIPYGHDVWCQPVIALHHMRPEENSALWGFEREREEHHSHEPLTYEELWKRFIRAEDLSAPRFDWDNLSGDFSNVKYNIHFDRKVKPGHASKHARKSKDSKSKDAKVEYEPLEADESYEACKAACDENEKCIQFSYTSTPTTNFNENGLTQCHLSSSMRLGTRRLPEDYQDPKGKIQQRSWKSGWRKDRFDKWAEQQRCHNN